MHMRRWASMPSVRRSYNDCWFIRRILICGREIVEEITSGGYMEGRNMSGIPPLFSRGLCYYVSISHY